MLLFPVVYCLCESWEMYYAAMSEAELFCLFVFEKLSAVSVCPAVISVEVVCVSKDSPAPPRPPSVR